MPCFPTVAVEFQAVIVTVVIATSPVLVDRVACLLTYMDGNMAHSHGSHNWISSYHILVLVLVVVLVLVAIVVPVALLAAASRAPAASAAAV